MVHDLAQICTENRMPYIAQTDCYYSYVGNDFTTNLLIDGRHYIPRCIPVLLHPGAGALRYVDNVPS
jgi:hypothetical protein